MKISTLVFSIMLTTLSLTAKASEQGKTSLASCYFVVNAAWTQMSKQEATLRFDIDSTATDPNGVDNVAIAKATGKLRNLDSSKAQLKQQIGYAGAADTNTESGFAVVKSFCALHGVELLK